MKRAPWRPRKVMDVELAGCIAGLQPLCDIEDLGGYGEVWALVRLHGTPVGTVEVPVVEGKCSSASLGRAILERHAEGIVRQVVRRGLTAEMPRGGWDPVGLLELSRPTPADPGLSMTVAVCTRNRPDGLARCLEALRVARGPGLDLLVVDNASETDAVQVLLEARFPEARYAREPRPGLDWARNRAILEASGEILAFTDDDAVPDPGWVRAVARAFAEQAEVMAVTGPVVPEELETEAQQLFEEYGGFGRGFLRRWCRADGDQRGRAVGHHRPAQFGTGANMAFRRDLFARIGGFDPALDVGTATGGGGDLEMFFRLMHEGHTLAYEPDAIVRHRHRRDQASLERQIAGWGSAFFAYVARSWTAYPAERLAFATIGARWFGRWVVRRGLASLVSPARHPWRLALAELGGAARGPAAWRRARREAAEIAARFGPQGATMLPDASTPPRRGRYPAPRRAVRRVDVAKPVGPLVDLDDCTAARVEVTSAGQLVGAVDIATHGPEVGATQLQEVLAEQFGTILLDPHQPSDGARQWLVLYGALAERLAPGQPVPAPRTRAHGPRNYGAPPKTRPDPTHV